MSLSAMIQHTTCQILAEKANKVPLTRLFSPKAVAVIGATDRQGSVGKTVVENLKKCLAASPQAQSPDKSFLICPVNPTRDTCCGLKCYKSISACPKPVDIAVIVTPAKTVAAVVEECGQSKVPLAIIISAGFKELGEAGLKLEAEVLTIAKKYSVRVIGPNCLGVMVPHAGLNATFAADHAIPGNIAFLSQSGAMCTAVLDWALDQKLGFSAFVSIGSMADVEWGDFLEYFERDPTTKSIVIYMETIGNVAHFMSAASAVSSRMPIFVIKAGQTDAAATAAASHTGSLVGSHDAFLTAMKRAGVMVLDSIQELFDVLLVVGKQVQPSPRSNLTIITNAGGPGVLATDAAAINGANLHPLKPEVVQELDKILPPAWSHANPIDVLGDASAALYAQTIKIALKDPESDGVLVILSPQSVTEPTPTAQAVIQAVQECQEEVKHKTILCSWMGSKEVHEGFKMLNDNNIPAFVFPDAAAKIFGKLAQYAHRRLQLKKSLVGDIPSSAQTLLSYKPGIFKPVNENQLPLDASIQLLKKIRQENRTVLTESESKQLLLYYDIPIAQTLIAKTQAQAVQCSERVGFPCVMKIHSSTITHKSDVGGVQLNLKSGQDVKEAWDTIQKNLKKYNKLSEFEGVTVQPMIDVSKGTELILGCFTDPQFGHLILFGTGGCMVEIFKDSALAIPPLDIVQSKLLIDSTKISKALSHTESETSRFISTDMDALNILLCKFSYMIQHLADYIAECDINPLLAMADKLVALDARIILKETTKSEGKTLAAGMKQLDQSTIDPTIYALPPYPIQYNKSYISKHQHKEINFYVTHASDVQRMKDFVAGYLLHQTSLTNDSTKDSSSPKLSSKFSLEDHMLPHVLFPNYDREYPLCAMEAKSQAVFGCSYLRKHPLDKQTAMLQFAMQPFSCVEKFLTQEDFRDIIGAFIAHTLDIARSQNITFVLAQVFQEFESKLMEQAGFQVNQNPNSKLWVCTYNVRKA